MDRAFHIKLSVTPTDSDLDACRSKITKNTPASIGVTIHRVQPPNNLNLFITGISTSPADADLMATMEAVRLTLDMNAKFYEHPPLDSEKVNGQETLGHEKKPEATTVTNAAPPDPNHSEATTTPPAAPEHAEE